MNEIAAVVLAAGASRRMGRNKLLLDLGGESVVRRAALTAVEAGLSPVIVVTGHEREAVEAAVRGTGCRTVHNARHRTGQHTSVGAGIAALAGDRDGAGAERAAGGDGGAAGGDGGRPGPGACAAAVVVLADMPYVTAAMLRTLAARYRETHAPLVISRYGDTIAPPMLYDRRLFGELTRMDRRCGREVVRLHRADAVEVEWPASALRDLDRPEDHERARRELAGGRVPMRATPGAAAEAAPGAAAEAPPGAVAEAPPGAGAA